MSDNQRTTDRDERGTADGAWSVRHGDGRDFGPAPADVARAADREEADAEGPAATCRRAAAVTLDRDADLGEVVLAILGECIAHVAGNRRAILTGHDPDGVHQMRVGVRRLRTALGLPGHLFASPDRQALAGELRWLTGALAPARCWDVFRADQLPAAIEALSGGTRARAIQRAVDILSETDAAEARAAVDSDRFVDLMSTVGRWKAGPPWSGDVATGRPGRDIAIRILDKRHRQVGRLAADADRRDVSELHAARLRLKKLRYTAEFFASLCSKRGVEDRRYLAYVAAMATVQSSLGRLNGALGVATLLDPVAPYMDAKSGACALGAIIGFHAGRAVELVDDARTHLAAFRHARPFWS